MATGIFELTIVVLIAAAIGVILRLFKQPIILAYLITGVIIARFGLFDIKNHNTLNVFSTLGVMFLLFLVGLEINYSSLRTVGKSSILLGILQVAITSVASFALALVLRFGFMESVYIAFALTFSSTIIVVKLLSEKRDLSSLYGKLTIGLLLVQDFFAVLLLIILSGVKSGVDAGVFWRLIYAVFKGAVLCGIMIYLGRRVMPFIFNKIARFDELLFLVVLAWLFLVSSIVSELGFSIEISGLLAGLSLAGLYEHLQIKSFIRPLRDFFILIFFAILGSQFVFSNIRRIAVPVIFFSTFVLIVKPFITSLIMGVMKYRRRTSFLTGITVGQISEFSLIISAMGLGLGHIRESTASVITATAVVTITISAYLITHADKIFKKIPRILSLLERKMASDEYLDEREYKKPIILIGAHRTGLSILKNIQLKDVLVIDFDPEVIRILRRMGVDYIFGDIADPEVFDAANFGCARLVISTNPSFEDNLDLLKELKVKLPGNRKMKIILRAEYEAEAKILYENGADYVLLPNFTAGQYLGKTISIDSDAKIIDQLKKRDLEFLNSSVD